VATASTTTVSFLEALADVATIITAGVATYAYLNYRWVIYSRRRRLETLLAGKTGPNDDSLTLQQLASHLGLTEDQVIEAASRSKKIEPWIGQSGKEYRFRTKRR